VADRVVVDKEDALLREGLPTDLTLVRPAGVGELVHLAGLAGPVHLGRPRVTLWRGDGVIQDSIDGCLISESLPPPSFSPSSLSGFFMVFSQ
jgi:hypothetical protein